MGSTRQPDRSLGSGISLPQWMKGRIDNRFDFDDSTFSPPSHDDSFFYIRYPKTQNQAAATQGFRGIGEVLREKNIGAATNQASTDQQLVSGSKEVREVDFSKHPLPCQPFIPSTGNRGIDGKSSKTTLIGNGKLKSQGTDDGFHGEPALCGKSIVHVANQMMSTKFSKTFMAEQADTQTRRVSKSLPATPIASPIASPDSSPKARRRVPSNRYFTGAFVPDREKYQGSRILASILGQSREILTAKIEEEDESGPDISPPLHKTLSRKKSISSQNLTYVGSEDKSAGKAAAHGKILQVKPSELREMNFWSPTSM